MAAFVRPLESRKGAAFGSHNHDFWYQNILFAISSIVHKTDAHTEYYTGACGVPWVVRWVSPRWSNEDIRQELPWRSRGSGRAPPIPRAFFLIQGQRGDRTSQPKRDHLMTYTKNIQKFGFRTERTSSKACYVGFHDRVSRQGNESAWLETPWALFLALTDQICSLRYWCPVGTSCYPRCPVRAHTHRISPKVSFCEQGISPAKKRSYHSYQNRPGVMMAPQSIFKYDSHNASASALANNFSSRYT